MSSIVSILMAGLLGVAIGVGVSWGMRLMGRRGA